MNKARRGELHLHLPVGFVYDVDGKVVLDSDLEVFTQELFTLEQM